MTKKKKKGRKMPKLIWPWAVAIGIFLVAAAMIVVPFSLKGAEKSVLVKVPKGADEKMLTDTLHKYFDKDYADKVMTVVQMQKRDVASRHGAYMVTEGMSPVNAGRLIMRGVQSPITITINGFRSLDVLSDRIARKMDFSKEDFLKTLKSDSVLQAYGITPEQALGLFINDSYQVYWSQSPEEVVEKIGSHYKKIWNDDRRAKAAALGLTPAEVMTLCSIVDEETNAKEEKGRIGRLYWNRLQKGMKLQADPTVRFACDDFTIKRVTGAHLKKESPYNTYLYQGLPPGPIRTTDVTTIDAFLDSKPSDDIYMCADYNFTGRHLFTDSYETHLANARRYQAALDSLGIINTQSPSK